MNRRFHGDIVCHPNFKKRKGSLLVSYSYHPSNPKHHVMDIFSFLRIRNRSHIIPNTVLSDAAVSRNHNPSQLSWTQNNRTPVHPEDSVHHRSLFHHNKYNYNYTNPFIIAAIEHELIKRESNFWWNGSMPFLELDLKIDLEIDLDDKDHHTQHSQRLQTQYRQEIQNQIGESMIQNISYLVQQRSNARQQQKYDMADQIKQQIQHVSSSSSKTLEDMGYTIQIKDAPRRLGGGSYWKLSRMLESQSLLEHTNHDASHAIRKVKPISTMDIRHDDFKNQTILQLAHAALGMVVYASEHNRLVDQAQLQTLVQCAKWRLANHPNVLKELQGRKAADAAFWFALSGVTSNVLFQQLIEISSYELNRYGIRSSCRIKDIFHVVERIAAAGARVEKDSQHSQPKESTIKHLYQIAADCLLYKVSTTLTLPKTDKHMHTSLPHPSHQDDNSKNTIGTADPETMSVISQLQSGHFDLHTTRPLLWIWKFSTKQRKQTAFLRSASQHWEAQAQTQSQSLLTTQTVLHGHDGEHEMDIEEGNKKDEDDTVFHDDDALDEDINEDGNNDPLLPWDQMFKDPTRPLIVDIGCGMGISLLGLASICPNLEPSPSSFNNHPNNMTDNNHHTPDLNLDWSNCNFLGGDLSRVAIGYANGISKRWNLTDTLSFCVISAEEMMKEVLQSYPGQVQLVMIQFPTPFRLQPPLHSSSISTPTTTTTCRQTNLNDNDKIDTKDDYVQKQTPAYKQKDPPRNKNIGNSQLPCNAKSGFMVTESLLTMIYKTLQKSSKHHNSTGKLLLQSNCEDVAVEMQRMAMETIGFQTFMISQPFSLSTSTWTYQCSNGKPVPTKITRRTKEWIDMLQSQKNTNDNIPRAAGSGWSARPLLPSKGATETEVSCSMNGTPIHRTLLQI